MAGLVTCPWRAGRPIGLAALLLLFGGESLHNAVAEGDTRTLTMHHTHTGEDITVTFKRNGRYDDAALQKLNWFLRDWRRDEPIKMDPHLFDVVWQVYQEVGAKEPIQIISAYRSPQTNAMLRRRSHSVAQHSLHMIGRAMDFAIPDAALDDIRAAGLRLQRGGVGFYPGSFVHLDTGGIRHWPRMTHDQLARVFPDGKTVHVPSDGHPLARYAVALAEVERRGGSPSTGAGSDDDGPTVAAKRSKRGILERLFGFGEDEEEDAEAAGRGRNARVTRTAARPDRSAEPAKLQLAAAVPLPPVRPARPNPPAKLESAASPSPAEIIKSRGMWGTEMARAELPRRPPVDPAATVSAAAPAPGAIGSDDQRFAWLATGAPSPPSPPAERSGGSSDPPRPPADIPTAEPETTASLGAWPDQQKDRVSPQLALAYAATAAPDPAAPRPAPMGLVRLAPPAAPPPSPAPRPASLPAIPAAAPPKPGERVDNPWLRGLLIAPSVHFSMKVAVFGARDYRQLATYMRKPTSALAMTFTADPNSGMTSEYFAGSAVAFFPTIKFVTRTAGLN